MKGKEEQRLEGGSASKEVFVDAICSSFRAEGKRWGWGWGAEASGEREDMSDGARLKGRGGGLDLGILGKGSQPRAG